MQSQYQIPLVLRSRFVYVWSIRTIQFLLFVVSVVAAFLLRFEFSIPGALKPALWTTLYVGVAAKVVTFHAFGLGRGLWRYFATRDLIRVAATNIVASALASAVLLTVCPRPFPRSVLVIDFLLTLLLTAGARAGTRVVLEVTSRASGGALCRAFIYGAGSAGSLLLNEARSNSRFNRRICGFIDDDPTKLNMLANGVLVRGAGVDLPELVAVHQIREVLIAIPSASGAQVSRIIEHCRAAGVSFRTVPSMAELVAGRGAVSQIRDVAVEDVLGRSTVKLDQGGISKRLRGRVALVTGAAGSIGSELCRQIACFEPAKLVALDMSETALFHLEREIRQHMPHVEFHAEIGNIQNRQRLRDVFGSHNPSVIYHAAAYKHVPLMEAHAFEAVENNVFGTYHLATVAAEFGVEDFVMISSDKAVRPTNIMGVTKRVSELLICSLQNGGPRFVSVRFGNVLGSNGSVVPIFQKQIAAGGPVTVTHPRMRRYFMTIPEAAQLVLQASIMGSGGEIFVLDMGQPVLIVDLARQLIRLSGLRPDKDIRIVYSGLRPGEKLCEELNLADEQTVPTRHVKITAFSGIRLPFERVIRHLSVLRNACEGRDLRALMLELKDMVPDYNPSKEVLHKITEPGLGRLRDAVGRDSGPAPADAVFSPISGVAAPCYRELS
jgi:FlaA1/EpsC-like NDP-sugar epimerase